MISELMPVSSPLLFAPHPAVWNHIIHLAKSIINA